MQEWCGTKLLQLNARDSHYKATSFSYFEGEGDQMTDIKKTLLEDEIFNLIRLDPSFLKTGEISIIPNSAYVQLMHKELKTYDAKASLTDYTKRDLSGKELKEYVVVIDVLQKSLNIVYENVYPYRIIRISESYPSAFDGKTRTTVAKLSKQKKIAYWSKNSLQDVNLRKDLGID